MTEFFRRMLYLLNRRQQDRELADEMEFHREMTALHGGAPFGNSLRLREEARDAWGWTWMESLAQDFRYAARKLWQSPGFTLAAILMLAIGIGANVAAFGIFNVIVFKPLDVRSPETLLRFKRRAPQSYASQVPYPEMDYFRRYTRTLSAVLGVSGAKLTVDGEDRPLNASFVTSNLFHDLGAKMTAGRPFDPDTDKMHNADPVVVLSHAFWQRHFGSTPVVGTTVRLNSKPATIIGVASAEFGGLSMDNPDLWVPITQEPYFLTGSRLLTDFSVDGRGVTMFGRLQPEATPLAAENELGLLAAELHKQYPADIWEQESLPSSPGGYAKNLGGGRHGTGRETSDEAYPLMAMVGALVLLILLVACGNLASLQLARGAARQREIAIRTAIGAGSGRLVRQLFTESALLGLLGSAAGLLVGYVVMRGLIAMTRTPAWIDATPDWRVLLFAIGMGFTSALLFGLTPVVQVVRQPHRIGNSGAELRGTNRMRQVLVGCQIAASCVIVIVAALLVRALNHAVSTSPGFEYQQVVSIDPGLAAHGYTAPQARNYLSALQNRLRSTPGIEAVSITSSAPLGNKKVVTGADINGRSLDVHMYGVDPEFFRTMKIPLLRGRNLTPNDTHGIVISKSFANQWPAGDALGRPFQMGSVTYTVIGVAGSARLVALEDAEAVEAYYLAGEGDLSSMVVLLKAAGPPEGLVPFVASVARSIDPKVFPEVELMKSSFRRKLDGPEHAAMTISVMGCVALLLACLGIVGLVTYAVSQRTREIGIRVALGANSAQVVVVVAGQLTAPICCGLLFGVGGAAALSQVLRRFLYGISSLDPLAYVAAIAALVLAVFAATVLPARRALRIDPMEALRCD